MTWLPAKLGRSRHARRIVASALLGILVTSFLIYPVILAAGQFYDHGNDYWLRDWHILEAIARGPGTFVLGVIVTAPLIAITVAISIVFEHSISRHPAKWCIAAPFVIYAFVCAWSAASCDNLYCRERSFFEVLGNELTEFGSLLYLFGSMPAAVIFYLLTIGASRTDG